MLKIVPILLLIITFALHASAQKIMFSNDYPPFNFVNEEGNLDGFNVDILKAINTLYNSDIVIKHGDWNEINEALVKGDVHAIGGAHYPGFIDNKYIYTRSAVNTSHCFLFNAKFKNKFSLEVLRSTHEPLVALWKNDVLSHYILSINPSTEFIYVDNYEQLLKALDQEDVTCIIAQRIGGMYYAKKLDKSYVLASDHRILERNMGFKVAKDEPELAAMLNNGLEILLSNGEYQRIYNKWLKEYNKDYNDWRKYLKQILLVSTIVFFIIILLLIANRILQSKVRNKTKDLHEQLNLNSNMLKELEIQKIKAEESERMKSSFLANMSHEIRTPMNGILGFTELLKSDEYSKEEQSQFIGVIQLSGNRMLNTINNIIDVSKLESGAEKIKISEVDIRENIDELHQFFTPEAKDKGLNLRISDLSNSTTSPFYTDEYKLNSILTNLIKNALKFTQDGFVKIEYNISNEKVKLTISDSGIGIPADKLKTIFNQFEQADYSYANGFEGSGLGLSITKGYVELLQGSIRIESRLNSGTTFYISLPNINSGINSKE